MDWHATQDYTFASVGDDKMLLVYVAAVFDTDNSDYCSFSWDTRAAADPVLKIEAHQREILAVSFSPAVDHLILTGSADNVGHAPICV